MQKMMPIGPMMIEHRLIERMIKEIGKEADRVEQGAEPNPEFVDRAVDFIRSYADECHHGKEENILFRELRKKKLSSEDDGMLRELIEDHKRGRDVTRRMVEANERYRKGDKHAFAIVLECMRELRDFYPVHIDKEDRHFFLPAMRYFTQEERDRMLQEGFDYDRGLIHRRYQTIVEGAELRHGETLSATP